MGKLIEKILEFFGNKALSLSKKMTIVSLVCLSILLIDNYCGFSYYFVQSYKLDYITSLEEARVKYAKDKIVSNELDRMMVNALNRWTFLNAVSDIFQKTFYTTSEARQQQLVDEMSIDSNKNIEKKIEKKDDDNNVFSKLFPIAERSPFWHTVCSCLLLILFILICVIYLACSPFIHDRNKKNAILGMCVIIPILIGIVLFFQWVVSFIPDIDNRPRINNLIYVFINISVLVYLIKKKAK